MCPRSFVPGHLLQVICPRSFVPGHLSRVICLRSFVLGHLSQVICQVHCSPGVRPSDVIFMLSIHRNLVLSLVLFPFLCVVHCMGFGPRAISLRVQTTGGFVERLCLAELFDDCFMTSLRVFSWSSWYTCAHSLPAHFYCKKSLLVLFSHDPAFWFV